MSYQIYDIKKCVMSSLLKSPVVGEAMKVSSQKKRVGMIMGAMKVCFASVPIGRFNGELWCFGGKCYRRMAESEFGALVSDCIFDLGLPYEDILLTEKVARVCRNEVMKNELVPQDNIVVFNNCVFDVETRMEYAFSPKFVQMTMVGYDHKYNEVPYEWLNFLDYVLPDVEKRKVLQEFLGSVFIDRRRAKLEKILILLGSGANGKSVVFDTVIGVLGRENVTNFGLGALIGGNDRKHSVAGINGKRLNYCSEIRAIEIGNDSDALKTLISGEPIEARVLNGQYFMASHIPLLMANANKMPRITDMSHGMKRRLCVLRFSVTVPRDQQDPLLSERLRDEYPGVFNWMIEGRERFIRNGYKLSSCPTVEEAFAEASAYESTVIRFAQEVKKWYPGEVESGEHCVWMPATKMYREYVKWCRGEHIIEDTMNLFGRTLTRFKYRRRRVGGGMEYALFGKSAKDAVVTDGLDIKKAITQHKELNESAWVTVDGNPMILGKKRLPAALGVSLKTIERCLEKGWFEGCYERVSSGWHAFDVIKCRHVLEAHGVYESGFRQSELRSDRANRKLERFTFNKRMEALELPYRKMVHRDRLKPGLVWVPDDMSVDKILQMEGGYAESEEPVKEQQL